MSKRDYGSVSYDVLYQKAVQGINSGDLKTARDSLYEASRVLNRMSLLARGEAKEDYLSRSQKLAFLADAIVLAPKITAKSALSEKAENGQQNADNTENGNSFFPVERPTVTMADIAGEEEVKKQINDQIVKPFENPELYARFKKSLGSGILLYGLPGTGKTMMAKAIANQLNGAFFSVKCSDILSKWVGEAEQNIKNLFQTARSYPVSIIFFDEFEAIGASREDTDKTEKDLVPEILAQMQGFENSQNTCICIAATNRPWMIDSAFLRPGRFGTHFKVDLPNEDARKQIFHMRLKDVPCGELDYDEMASLTEGYNAADIADGFIEKMKQYAIDRALENGGEAVIEEKDAVQAAEAVKSSVSSSDIDNLKRFEAGQMDKSLSGFAPEEKPSVTFDDVKGLFTVKKEIQDQVITPRLHPEIYAKFGKQIETGILLYGLPGTGKTMIAKAIANGLDAAFFSVRCSDILSKWVGGSESNVKNLFDAARRYKTAIIFFDEFEAIGSKREDEDKATKALVPEILAEMQGFKTSKNTLLVLAATNRPWMIDSAFLRPGRFGTHIRVDLPDDEARKAMFVSKLKTCPCSPDLDLARMVALTQGFNAADVADGFIEKMKQLAIDRALSNGGSAVITNGDVEQAAKLVHSSVDPQDVENLKRYEAGEYR
jgi:transitional endoplasmic reticulum ATPase